MSEHPDELTLLMAKEQRSDPLERQAHMVDMVPSAPNQQTHDVIELKFLVIEVVVFILLFAYSLSATVLQAQILYQTCTSVFGYNVSECRLLGTRNESERTKEIEALVQPYAARVFWAMRIIESIIPSICGVFVGSWLDRFGRKPFLITSFTGYVLYYTISWLIAIFSLTYNLSPWLYLLAVLPNAFLGAHIIYGVAASCYISDTTPMSKRGFRMTLYEAFVYLGLMMGSFVSGYWYEATNGPVVILTSAMSVSTALFIICLYLPESLQVTRSTRQNRAVRDSPYRLFDWQLLRNLLETCFKPRSYNNRSIVWLCLTSLLLSAFVVDGSSSVFYLFVRKQFSWTVKQFTTYETFSILVPIVGNLLGLLLFKKVLHWSVVMVAIVGFTSNSLSNLMKAFAFDDKQLYFAILLGVFKAMANPMCKTIVANIVPKEELGQVLLFYGMLQGLLPFLATTFYTIVYSITLISFPGFFNLMNANFYALCIGFMLTILRKQSYNPEYYKDRLH